MELREFLYRVVGQGSVTQNGEGEWSIKPYEIVITTRERNHVNGYISFKGERFQEFTADVFNDLKIIETIVESLNHGYGSAIKDVILNGNINETIKPFKFI